MVFSGDLMVSEVTTKRALLVKAAKLITVNHIKKLPELMRMNRKYESIGKTFAFLFALGTSSFTKPSPIAKARSLLNRFENSFDLKEFIGVSPNRTLSKLLQMSMKVDAMMPLKPFFEEFQKRHPIPQTVQKKVGVELKSILGYVQKFYDYLEQYFIQHEGKNHLLCSLTLI